MIYPHTFPNTNINNKSERTVFQYLERFKDDYDIFYSKRFISASNGERPEYEIDFIISDRQKGILVLEVKGGLLEYDGESNTWYQSGRPMDKSPDLQASKAAHSLVNRYPNLSQSIPIGWAVCYPDCELPVHISNPTNIPRQLIIDRNQLLDLDSALNKAFSEWRSKFPNKPGCKNWEYENFKKSLLRGLGFVQRLQVQIKHDEQQFIKLTERQFQTFRRALENPKIIVKGPAGSGKTILAKTLAEEFSEEGKNVLLMCYNRTLSKKLRYDTSSKHNKNLEVTRFHQLASHTISAYDEDWWDKQQKNQSFWDVDIAVKLEEVSHVADEEFDVLIIDEAQDFNELWYEALFGFLSNEKHRIILFTDEKQNIFDRDLRIPNSELFTNYHLPENCRNTKTIISYLSDLIGSEILHFDSNPVGKKIESYELSNSQDLENKLIELVDRLINKEGIKTDQLILLLNSQKSNSSISDLKKIGKFQVRSLPDNARFKSNTIHYTHIESYKGLESDIVIIIDAQGLSESKLYTEASRAKHKLIILAT